MDNVANLAMAFANEHPKLVLMDGIRRIDPDMIRAALYLDPDLIHGQDNQGRPWLIHLAKCRSPYKIPFDEMTELVVLLLDHGANPNSRCPETGETALMALFGEGYDLAAKRLLEAGADPDLADIDGWTALMRLTTRALSYRASPGGYWAHDDIGRGVKILLDKGANPNPPGREGRQTALHLAAYKGITPMCKLLIERGARVDVRDGDGIRPSEAARRQGHVDCAALIEAREQVVDCEIDLDVMTDTAPARKKPRSRL